jgi:hypothetical protein
MRQRRLGSNQTAAGDGNAIERLAERELNSCLLDSRLSVTLEKPEHDDMSIYTARAHLSFTVRLKSGRELIADGGVGRLSLCLGSSALFSGLFGP